jgi:hypothetical protein
MFTTNSRYYSLPILTFTRADGSQLSYASRRFLPSGDEFDLLFEHRVIAGERLDNITAQYLDDPEQFWRVCDANDAMSAFDLTATPGYRIRITLPQGISGATVATALRT